MIGKLMGIADIITAVLFVFYNNFGIFPEVWVSGFAIYLLIKGGIFSIGLDIASIIDVICALTILASLHFGFMVSGVIVGLISLYLLIKGVMSLVS